MDQFGKLIDLLKTTGWQSAALCAATGLFMFLGHAGIIPSLEGGWLMLGYVVLFATAALAVAAVAEKLPPLVTATLARGKAKKQKDDFREKFRKYIPFMTERERHILGYLLKHRQKVFTAESDGGYAGTLLSQGFITIVARPGQHVDYDKVPMGVPDLVWEVMEARPDDFKYTPEYRGNGRDKVEMQPWWIPWGAR